mmetsp:Transcript_43345/g.101677  ORF Transcript_43345/g.101677 Transcript_43345/m.101677 type:complete len:166 (-) Transcript_43345:737-1234(-)
MERGSIKKTSEEESSKVIPPAPTRRQNPYAKRKPPPLNSQSSTGASFSEPATAPKSLPINNTRIRNTNLPAQSNVCDFGLVGTVEAQAITFSQAFGDEGESGKRDSGHKFNTRQGGRSGGSSGKPLAACIPTFFTCRQGEFRNHFVVGNVFLLLQFQQCFCFRLL